MKRPDLRSSVRRDASALIHLHRCPIGASVCDDDVAFCNARDCFVAGLVNVECLDELTSRLVASGNVR